MEKIRISAFYKVGTKRYFRYEENHKDLIGKILDFIEATPENKALKQELEKAFEEGNYFIEITVMVK